MAKQLRRHCKLPRLSGHLDLYVSSSNRVCLNDFSLKLFLFETEIGTLNITWRRCSLLDPSAGSQIFLIETSGWLTKGLAFRALSKPIMFSGGFLPIPVPDSRPRQEWQDQAYELRRLNLRF
jgi:hypothetical protein